jgi:uncharacterized membrane protein SirB2
MAGALRDLIHVIDNSAVHDAALYLLGSIPGFPPMVQTVHILGISCVMGSIVLIDLKVLGLALPSQSVPELVRRLMPWMWWALLFVMLSGLTLFVARPGRYLANPLFGIKFALLIPAVVLAAVFQRLVHATPDETKSIAASQRAVALVSLLLWIGVVMAGRWIAYADYLFPAE